jgi:hypothetical protein
MIDCKEYANYATWDIMYWSMDEITYRNWPDQFDGTTFTVETVRSFIHNLLGDVTHHGVRLDDESVNWEEIARSWTDIFDPVHNEAWLN